MTTPIRPEPPSNITPPSPQKENVLKGAAEKVAKAASDVNHLLTLPNDLRQTIVTSLTENDLDALEISLSKGDAVQTPLKPALKHLKDLIAKTRQNLTYQNLLKDHPDWKQTVDAWNVKIEEKIWLIRIHELGLLENIPEMEKLYFKYTPQEKYIPTMNSPELLHKREQINKHLESITEINWYRRGLRKCPSAICLLVNLKKLELHSNDLRVPPDVRLNTQLENLEVSGNGQLTESPNLSRNVKLRFLNLYGNRLNKPPNLESNVNLEVVDLGGNLLTEAPNLSKNLKIGRLSLTNNRLTVAPDVSALKELWSLAIDHNQIVEPPNLRSNLELQRLDLAHNQMATLPDLTQNQKLNYICCFDNSLPNELKIKLQKEMAERGIEWLI